jgi:hypothetical protein
MKPSKPALFLSLAFGFILIAAACTSAASPTVQPVQEETNPSLSSQRVETDSSYSFKGASLSLDPSLFSGASGEAIPAKSTTDGPYWDVNPEYRKIVFSGYPVSESAYKPVIAIYPVEEFRSLSEPAGKEIELLQTILKEKPGDIEKIPVLPLNGSAQVFRSNIKYIPFQNGSGVRFVGMNSQGIVPVNNNDLIYAFQGLTTDGKFYISVILPVNYPTLPARWDSLPEAERLKMLQDPKYLPDLAANLSAQLENSFLPDLAKLDALVQSIKVNP